MKLINAELKKKELSIKDLPIELQQRVADFQQMIFTYNELYDKVQESDDDEEKKELDEKEHQIAEEEVTLAREIREVTKQEPSQEQLQAEGQQPATEKKEETGIGWLVFGAVVLVGTLGLVNVLKKK